MMKRVVVTGASGFIGRRLVASLVQQGYEVTGIDIRTILENKLRHRTSVVEADLCDPKTYTEHLSGVEAVVHAAAYIPFNHANPGEAADCFRVNTLATLALLQECERRNVLRFIYFSSGAVYSGLPTHLAVSEDARVYPDAHSCFYAASKLAGELFVSCFHRRGAFSAICLRLGSVYGLGMRSGAVVARFMAAAAQGEPLRVVGGGRAVYDYVYVDDVVDIATRCIDAHCSGVINVGSGRGTSVLELAKTIVKIFPERPVNLNIEPATTMDSPGLPPLNSEKAVQYLGFKPRTLEEGLTAFKHEMEQQRIS